jgi:NAD-dependent deacetylase
MSDQAAEVGRLLRSARRVLFITGAGVSAESGIPTFRGLAAAFPDGRTPEGERFEEVLSFSTFVLEPALPWKYLFRMEEAMRGSLPNAAHRAIAALETPQRSVCVATQNIDGLHQEAGSTQVLELHGNLRRIVCCSCDFREVRTTFAGLPALPRCGKCGGWLRPNVVLYEEPLPAATLGAFIQEQQRGFDLVFSVGTTSLFSYVTDPILRASADGTPVVEINPEPTLISNLADYRFAAPAGQVLSDMVRAMEPG